MQKIGFYISMTNNKKILELLEKNPALDYETLKDMIIKRTQVEPTTADAYIKSWRHNHKEGAIGAISKAVKRSYPADERIVEEGNTFEAVKEKPAGTPQPIEGVSKIAAIIRLHEQGYTNAQIIAAGYNKSTVGRQVGEYKKRKASGK